MRVSHVGLSFVALLASAFYANEASASPAPNAAAKKSELARTNSPADADSTETNEAGSRARPKRRTRDASATRATRPTRPTRPVCKLELHAGEKLPTTNLPTECRALVLKHNAKIALEADKDDDGDDVDDAKTEATAQSIEAQKAAAQADVEEALDLIESKTKELEEADGTPEEKELAKAVEEAIKAYDVALDKAATVADSIAARSKKELRGSIDQQRGRVAKLRTQLKTTRDAGTQAEIQNEILDNEDDIEEKEELHAKADVVNEARQTKIASFKLGAGRRQAETHAGRFNLAKGKLSQIQSKLASKPASKRGLQTKSNYPAYGGATGAAASGVSAGGEADTTPETTGASGSSASACKEAMQACIKGHTGSIKQVSLCSQEYKACNGTSGGGSTASKPGAPKPAVGGGAKKPKKAKDFAGKFKDLAGNAKDAEGSVKDGIKGVKDGIDVGKSAADHIKKGNYKALIGDVKKGVKTVKSAVKTGKKAYETGKDIVEGIGDLF